MALVTSGLSASFAHMPQSTLTGSHSLPCNATSDKSSQYRLLADGMPLFEMDTPLKTKAPHHSSSLKNVLHFNVHPPADKARHHLILVS